MLVRNDEMEGIGSSSSSDETLSSIGLVSLLMFLNSFSF